MKQDVVVNTLNWLFSDWLHDEGGLCWLNSYKKGSRLYQYRLEIDEIMHTLIIDWNRTINIEVELENIWTIEKNFAGYLEIRTRSYSLIHALVPEKEK